MPSWPACMKFKQMLGQRNTLVFALIVGRLWKPFTAKKVFIGRRAWKGVECYLYPAHSGSVLGPWTWWGTRKQNCRQACKRLFCLKVCRNCAVPGVLRQNIKRKIKCWEDNQHLVMWHSLSSTDRQAQKLILGPNPTTKTRFLSFTGHNPGLLLAFFIFT
jgi:hypothetical protein